MSIVEALEDQLRRSMGGPAWHGPSVREALDDFDAAAAATHPIPDAHSCWELVLHLAGSYRLVLRRLDGNAGAFLPQDDWPPMPEPTAENWKRDVEALYELNARMRERVLGFPIERLFEPIIAEPPYPAFTQFIGLTQHDLYHAGQIVLLKRALEHQTVHADAIRPRFAHVVNEFQEINRRSSEALIAFDEILDATAAAHSREVRDRVAQYDDPRTALADMEREADALAVEMAELQQEVQSVREQASLRAQQAWGDFQKMHEEMERRVHKPMELDEARAGEIEAELSECARMEKDYRAVIQELRTQINGGE